MSWQMFLVAAVVLAMFGGLAGNLASAEIVVLGAVALLTTAEILTPTSAIAGFANEGLATVGLMFVLVAGLTHTGVLARVITPLLGRPKGELEARIRLMIPVAGLSAFLNNTALVAMFMPVVSDWCRRTGVRPSKLFMPLSFAAILGGTCTMIGTSTNLVVHGMLAAAPGGRSLGLMELGWVGVPCAIVGIVWCVVMGTHLLPDRGGVIAPDTDPREYTVEMNVSIGSPLIGQSIEAAGLRHLPGLFLSEIERSGRVLLAVGPLETLEAADRLVFVGVVDSVKDLQKIRGLLPAGDEVSRLAVPRSERCLVEAVVSDSSPLVGQSVRKAAFRSQYHAVVIAVARKGQRILGTKIGDIVLRTGDTLLIEAHPGFADQHRHSRLFYLVSAVEDSSPPRHDRAYVALAILLAVVGLAAFEVVGMLQAALLGAVAMVLTGCCTASEARRSVDLSVLTVIAGSFAVGKAIESTGLASLIADRMTSNFMSTPHLALAAIYALTMVLNAAISNNGAVALVFPIAAATADRLGVSLLPFGAALMMAGSNDFATPIGYQTNLMVSGPGGYRFADYLRFGGPLNLLLMGVAVILIPVFWPF